MAVGVPNPSRPDSARTANPHRSASKQPHPVATKPPIYEVPKGLSEKARSWQSEVREGETRQKWLVGR